MKRLEEIPFRTSLITPMALFCETHVKVGLIHYSDVHVNLLKKGRERPGRRDLQ